MQQAHGLPLDSDVAAGSVGELTEAAIQGRPTDTEAALTDEDPAGAWPEGHSSWQQAQIGMPPTAVAASVADESAEAQFQGGVDPTQHRSTMVHRRLMGCYISD